MTVCASPSASYLVGALQWQQTEDDRLFFFAANGDRATDGHTVTFTRAAYRGEELEFYSGDERVACLCPIANARVEDPDDYLIGWEIWRQVAPLKGEFIDKVFAGLAAGGHSTDGGTAG